jgi:hypothetical protein
MIDGKGEAKMTRLILAAMILATCVTAYSCASKCVSTPPAGGYSYDSTTEKSEQGERK